MSLYHRHFQEPTESYFLFGPRGTGKTTLIRKIHPDALWLDLLQPELERSLLARPEMLISMIQAAPHKKTVVIDEVQKVPALLNVVHLMIEKKEGYQFVLTGSSSRKLKRTGANLLGGRALKKTLHPFMASELGSDFDLDQALFRGMLPLLVHANDPKSVLEGYISLYLKEEIQAEGLIRNLEQFSRFLDVISFSHGSILNITNIARESEIKRSTVGNYIDILEELLLAYQLPVFEKRAARRLTSHPKFYLFDCGVFQILRPKGPLDRLSVDGIVLEGLVAQHLVAWCDYSRAQASVYFWRTRSDLEVDFVIYGEESFYAIEVKSSHKVFSHDLKGLKAFLTDYPEAKAFLLYQGKERLKIDDILCIPIAEFLRDLVPNKPLAL
ncbi:MAG: AAA family ATPase [Chlamydiota bacterium]